MVFDGDLPKFMPMLGVHKSFQLTPFSLVLFVQNRTKRTKEKGATELKR